MIGSLFSGAAGLDMAAEHVLGLPVAWHCENDPAASRLLAYRYPHMANLGDITAVDWTRVEPVDVLVGGFPCTDVSLAGARAGMHAHTRSGLWSEFARAINELRPSLVLIENVRGLLSAEAASDMEPCAWCVGDGPDQHVLRALGAVLGNLASLGYDAEWVGIRAADVGAPHGRFRVFVAAHTANVGHERCGQTRGRRIGLENGGLAVPDPASVGLEGSESQRIREPVNAGTFNDGRTPADTESERRTRRDQPCSHMVDDGPQPAYPGTSWGDYKPAIRRWEHLTRPAPPPTVAGPKGGQRLNPDFTDWMMGWPDGWTDVPGVSRNDRLRMCGNGVVPQQAVAAFTYLLGAERAA